MSSTDPLKIAILWHMHQPNYQEPGSKRLVMPWVRLHGTKDYLDMVQILRDYPKIHQTFNVVPSLIEQIQDYEKDAVKDAIVKLLYALLEAVETES